MKLNTLSFLQRSWLVVLGLGLITIAAPGRILAADQQTFSSPDAAVSALTAATKTDDTNSFRAIFGVAGRDLVSPDAVQAAADFNVFQQRLTEKIQLTTNANNNLTLQLGADGWPFPIPLLQTNGQWFFDAAAGKEEILNRRIGMDELGVIAVCNAYVQAQREYASQDRSGDGVLAYAQFLKSSPGKHDGLFWPTNNNLGETFSPLGPLIAQAHVEGYRHTATIMNEESAPYHGYYFEIMTKQGKHAPGGKYNYIINGRMLAGFALVAWPAEWGNTGVMTFIVNQQGKIYQKNLGPKTVKIANDMSVYDPDVTWTLVQVD